MCGEKTVIDGEKVITAILEVSPVWISVTKFRPATQRLGKNI